MMSPLPNAMPSTAPATSGNDASRDMPKRRAPGSIQRDSTSRMRKVRSSSTAIMSGITMAAIFSTVPSAPDAASQSAAHAADSSHAATPSHPPDDVHDQRQQDGQAQAHGQRKAGGNADLAGHRGFNHQSMGHAQDEGENGRLFGGQRQRRRRAQGRVQIHKQAQDEGQRGLARQAEPAQQRPRALGDPVQRRRARQQRHGHVRGHHGPGQNPRRPNAFAGATRQRFADVVHPSTPSRKIERNAGLSSTNISIDAPRGSVKWARAPRAAGKNRPFCGSPPPAAVLYNAGEVMAVRMLRRKPQPSLLLRARAAALGLLAGLAVLLTGCFPLLPAVTGDPPETGGATGQLLITVHAAGLTAETFHRPLETLRVTLTKPRGSTGSAHAPVLRREVLFSAGGSMVEFQAIETGLWKVTAEILDAEGVPVYGGTGEVLVRDRETAAAQITALPLPGQLEVRIDLGEQCIEVSEAGACLADLADRGHVRFLPTASMNPASRSFDWPEQARSAVITVQDVPFGDIEYQL